MRPFLRRVSRLQLRLLSVVLGGALLFAMLAGVVVYRNAYERMLDQGRHSLQDLMLMVHKGAAAGAFARDRLLMQEVIDGMARHPLIVAVQIRDAKGTVLAGTDGLQADAVALERALFSPFDAEERIGVLQVHANARALTADARRFAAWAAGGMCLLIGLVAVLLYVAAERMVSRPIVRLAQSLRAMQPGSAEQLHVPPGHAHDEIGALITDANALLQSNAQALARERSLRLEIERMEAQYRQIFDSTSAGIFVLDAEGRLINGNPTVMKVIGAPLNEVKRLSGDEFLRRIFADPQAVRALMRQAGERRETASADLELLQSGSEARWVHCLISVQGGDGRHASAGRLVEGVMYDITERKRAEQSVRHRADHDALTGLKSRSASEAAIDRLLAEAEAGGTPATLMFLDLDGFKRINDTHGHKAGDQVLRVCAQRMLRAARRASDVVGRVGGDEFVIALPHTAPDDPVASAVAAALIETLALPVSLDNGVEVQVGVSVGMACHPLHGSSRRQLSHCADEALYAVKHSGKNAYAMAVAAVKKAPAFPETDSMTLWV